MPTSLRPGDELSGRYRLIDLLDESGGGRFFRGFDSVLARHVAIHVLACDDDRADLLSEAARQSASLHDQRILRVLDTDNTDNACFVVNEWGSGRSLDIVLAAEGPLTPQRSAWIASEVASALAAAHTAGVAHGRLVPENVLIDHNGHIRLIGLAVDAALHGLPSGRRSADVVDTAGVLYACLTGRWAGVSDSVLPPAHREGAEVLRPRRVRAGIPRVLDQLCDGVLNDHDVRGLGDVRSAAGLAEILAEYVGDPTGLPEAEAARLRTIAPPPTVIVPVLPPDQPPRAPQAPPPHLQDTSPRPEPVPEPTPEPEPTPAPTPTPEPTADADPTDVPTQAGLPVFDDERDDVSWISASGEQSAPPPPPKLDDPAPRPLFAPDPEDGRPLRTPRPGTAAARQEPEYWPWDASSSLGTGTGAVPPYASTDFASSDFEQVDDSVPGRGWLRIAMLIAALCIGLLVVVFAFGLGRGSGPFDPGEDESSPTQTSEGALTPIEGVTATDFDPQGQDREEYPELAPLAVDGDPETSWHTATYDQQFGPGGLKTGVGLLLDLGEVTAPRQVDVTVSGRTSLSLYLTANPPQGVRTLDPVATAEGDGDVRLTLKGQDRGRYLVVWLTQLPEADGGFRGEVSDVVVSQ